MPTDLSRSLTELESKDWGPPTYPSSLVARCHELRHRPVRELGPGDLRVLIGQKIGLSFLVPIALQVLAADPFVEGDYYQGDLLKAVADVSLVWWDDHPELRESAAKVGRLARERLKETDSSRAELVDVVRKWESVWLPGHGPP